jgi:LemA protein
MSKQIIFGILAFLVLIIGVPVLVGISSYNGLVNKQQAVDSSWAQVQNVYQRRADLIPNLVQTVQGAASFEKSTLIAVTDARASVGKVTIDANSAPNDAAKLQEFENAQGQLSNALSHLLVVSERYPELKANGNFVTLQAQLEGSENRIATERGRFNDAVQDYDASIKRFPAVLLAGMFGFTSKPYFAATDAAQTVPTVNFNFSTTNP